MATIQRPTKEGSVRTYQEKVGLGFVDILASEMDADLDTIYAAWNGGVDSVTLKDLAVTTPKIVDGAVTYAKLAADAKLWEDTGTRLRPGPSFATRPLTLSSTAQQLLLGSATIKGHVHAATDGTISLMINDAGTPQDTTKSSWQITANATADAIQFWRRAPAAAAGYSSTPFVLDGVGNLTIPVAAQLRIGTTTVIGQDINLTDIVHTGDASHGWTKYTQSTGSGTCEHTFWQSGAGATATFNKGMWLDSAATFTIAGATAFKASGTTWANPSDRRLKDDIADYATGLAAITQLQPRTFVYNGKGGSPAGLRGYGFIADEVEPVMPEMVGVRAGKLDPDDEAETDIQTLDQSNLILALVNAVRELAARLTAVETAAA
jgi:Chaperone of endosialidase